jgi:hypothetical protein
LWKSVRGGLRSKLEIKVSNNPFDVLILDIEFSRVVDQTGTA